MIRTKEVNEVLKAFKKLTVEEQAEIKRKILLEDVKKRVDENWEKYPNIEMSDEEIMKELKALRKTRKK